jgi:hypothetical protein
VFELWCVAGEGPDVGQRLVTLPRTRQITRRELRELSRSDRTPCGGTFDHSLGASGLGAKALQQHASGRGHTSSGRGFGESVRLLTRARG